ncbi:IclR family transcriptional regulator [Rhodococcus sp. 114MFTsu3.1]|uniref:IclR family transcriptional regulator n=1 Tax=Rhodococcus sp. 114MFTsu3.1 TaxID=1172184 RepID=UPI0003A1DBC6|nr:IclR family transcriptional regulator C-terminal domain-containing protein [Rhodococcus sp. 114MFTsu3.1]
MAVEQKTRGESERPRYPVGSVGRVLQLLDLVAGDSAPRAADVATALGVSRATVHRLVSLLQHEGYVQLDSDTHRYHPGTALISVARTALRNLQVRAVGLEQIANLRDDSGETVELCVMDGDQSVVVATAESRRPLRVVDAVGDRMSAHLTASGKAMLSAMTPLSVIEMYPRDTLPAPTARSIDSRSALIAELAAARAAGWATNRGEGDEDFVGIAAPVVDGNGQVRGAVTIALPTDRAEEEFEKTLGPSVIATALAIADRLDADTSSADVTGGLEGSRKQADLDVADVGTVDRQAGSASKSLRLLDLLARQKVVRVTEVARQLNVAPSTAHRLLGMLQHHRFASRDSDRTYRFGTALLHLALRVGDSSKVNDAATRWVTHLADLTGETCSLWTHDEGDQVKADFIVEGSRRTRVVENIGVPVPADLCAPGLALGEVLRGRRNSAHELRAIEEPRRYHDHLVSGRITTSGVIVFVDTDPQDDGIRIAAAVALRGEHSPGYALAVSMAAARFEVDGQRIARWVGETADSFRKEVNEHN